MLPIKFQFIWLSGFRGEIKMWKVNGRWTTNDERQVMAKAHIAFGKMN
jgi:hypothetical protein